MSDLITELEKLTARHRTVGAIVRSRLKDWVGVGRVPSSDTRGGGLAEATPELLVQDRRDDRKASTYLAELERVEGEMLDLARRHNEITAMTIPPAPRKIEGRDMLAGQVAGAGLCVSCFRVGELVDREKRPDGSYYYADSCRSCGGFRGAHGMHPPVPLLEYKKTYRKNWTERMVQEALDEARKPKGKAR